MAQGAPWAFEIPIRRDCIPSDVVYLDHTQSSERGRYLVLGIDGDKMVGFYEDSSGAYHGFMVTVVPEPTTALLLSIWLVGLSMRRRGAS